MKGYALVVCLVAALMASSAQAWTTPIWTLFGYSTGPAGSFGAWAEYWPSTFAYYGVTHDSTGRNGAYDGYSLTSGSWKLGEMRWGDNTGVSFTLATTVYDPVGRYSFEGSDGKTGWLQLLAVANGLWIAAGDSAGVTTIGSRWYLGSGIYFGAAVNSLGQRYEWMVWYSGSGPGYWSSGFWRRTM
jgi:hypothetical protein